MKYTKIKEIYLPNKNLIIKNNLFNQQKNEIFLSNLYCCYYENKYDFKYLYENVYLNFIKILIKYCHFNFKWISFIDNNISIKDTIKNSFQTINNPYINTNRDISFLAKDIEKKGIYFPFIAFQNSGTGNYQIWLGSHRAYSLISEQINKKFLMIIIPDKFASDVNVFKEKLLNDITDKELFIPVEIQKKIHYVLTNNISLILYYFFCFSEFLGENIFYYKNEIYPNQIFNNEKKFGDFLNDKTF